MTQDSIAIDADGHPLPYTAEEVDAIVRKSIEEGDLLAAVIKMPDGNLSVQVLGEPCEALADALDVVAKSYRVALRGH